MLSEKEEDKPCETCATKYPNKPQSKFQQGYPYTSQRQALIAQNWVGYKLISPKPSYKGTCVGSSTHWNVRDPQRGSDRVGSLASCECCDDKTGTPILKTIYRAF